MVLLNLLGIGIKQIKQVCFLKFLYLLNSALQQDFRNFRNWTF